MADSLYQDNNAATSHVKTYYTTASAATVGSFDILLSGDKTK